MYFIQVMICFLQLANATTPVCFPSGIPLEYKTMEQCKVSLDSLVELINEDLKERKVSMVMRCLPVPEKNITSI
tara:strand:- start:260 stop:481 length:222 start_codon:yes stop_codon:yes gene_type:complete